RLACDLALHLRAKGHPVTIVTSAINPKTDTSKNLTVIRVEGDDKPNGAWAYFKILKRMERAAKKLPRHDIVISMTDPPMLATVGDRVARSMRSKHIHWAMDLYPDLLPVLGANIPAIIQKIIHYKIYNAVKKADALVPISECIAKHIAKNTTTKQSVTIENWPERSLLKQEECAPFFKDTDQKFRILYAGTIGLAHDFEALLSAATYFKKHSPEIEFVFVGGGRGLSALEKKAKDRALFNIRFLSHQPTEKIKSMMEGGDLHLVTIKDRAAGLLYPSKFYSACAVGRPIIYIGPKECEIHKNIQTHQCGASIRTTDSQALIKSITEYRNNAKMWNDHAQNAKTIIALSPNKNLKQWDDLIAHLNGVH
ncbi:MAG: hypothetical protein COB76_04370, partial [Alphaproteobacteria bacterium]